MKTLFNFSGNSKVSQSALLASAFLLSLSAFAQEETVQDSVKTNSLDEVLVQSVRATAQSPVTFSNISKEQLAPRNLGQDIPVLLNYLPSVVTTTDAGNGIGYTSMRVRGSDATRINVTLNGIPYNDAESQGSFWVNMGDFASSAENIQLQRGVGTSTNGAGAFGASLNVLTDAFKQEAGGELSNSFGSFNSRKHTVKFTSGLIGNRFELAGRLSNIASSGYIDRASSDLKSYFLQGTYVGNTTLIKALVFGGNERTYQAWNGIDAETLEENRRFNSSGLYTDDDGSIRYYDNETDNYQQDHYQLHWNERLTDAWSTNIALHYTRGSGYYENYRDNDTYADYGLENPVVNGVEITEEDLITRKWLDNDFYGTTFSANYKEEEWNVTLGGAWNKYAGEHFGNVIWARYSGSMEPDDRYYSDYAVKTDLNFYGKANYRLTDKFNLFGDLQYRTVNYQADGVLADPVDDTFEFWNPKAGITYTLNDKNNIYFSYARANREPRRDDYENGSYKPEQLNDFELGWRYKSGQSTLNVNGYYMRYKDQLVLTGALNDVGAPIYTNSGDSYRMGIEIDATIALLGNKLFLRPNVAFSANKNLDFYFSRDGVLQNLGDTDIAFSPSIVAANAITVIPVKGMQVSLLSKFVGEQYMGNIDSEVSKLDSYFINDLNISYEFTTNTFIKSVMLSGLVNNIFAGKYVSNGYFFTYDDDFSNPGTIETIEGAGYYPQARTNFLVGATLKF